MTPLQEMFIPIFGVAAVISAVLAFIGGRVSGVIGPLVLVCISGFVCWFGLFLGLEVGYQVWQSVPDPPAEAFSDTAPMGALFAGWIPGGLFACFWFFVSWLIRKCVWKRKDDKFSACDLSRSDADVQVVDTRNAYQPPTS